MEDKETLWEGIYYSLLCFEKILSMKDATLYGLKKSEVDLIH